MDIMIAKALFNKEVKNKNIVTTKIGDIEWVNDKK